MLELRATHFYYKWQLDRSLIPVNFCTKGSLHQSQYYIKFKFIYFFKSDNTEYWFVTTWDYNQEETSSRTWLRRSQSRFTKRNRITDVGMFSMWEKRKKLIAGERLFRYWQHYLSWWPPPEKFNTETEGQTRCSLYGE